MYLARLSWVGIIAANKHTTFYLYVENVVFEGLVNIQCITIFAQVYEASTDLH